MNVSGTDNLRQIIASQTANRYSADRPIPKLSSLTGARWLCFAVVDKSGQVVSVHQHPDSAQALIASSPRADLTWIEVDPS